MSRTDSPEILPETPPEIGVIQPEVAGQNELQPQEVQPVTVRVAFSDVSSEVVDIQKDTSSEPGLTDPNRRENQWGAFRRIAALALLSLIGVNSSGIPAALESAAAQPVAAAEENARTPKVKVRVPKISGLSPQEARQEVLDSRLRFGGLQPDAKGKKPKAKAGHELEATGLSKKIIKRVPAKKPGKFKNVIRYKLLKPGTKHPKNTKVYLRTKQVKLAEPVVPPPDRTLPVGPEIIAPVPIPVNPAPRPEPPRQENPDPTPEIVDLDAATATYIDNNSAYVEFSGCSGLFYGPKNGTPKAVSLSEHCGLMPQQLQREVRADGKSYINLGGRPRSVSIGKEVGNLTTRMNIDRVLVPLEAESAVNDSALGIREGVSNEEALKLAAEGSLSESERARLMPGDELIFSAYPSRQPYNTRGGVERQAWKLDYLAGNIKLKTVTWAADGSEAYKDLTVLMAGMKESADGAICTSGASGGSAFKRITSASGTRVDFKSVGANVGNYDLKRGPRNTYGWNDNFINELIVWANQTTGRDVSNYDALCFFQPLDLSRYTVLHLN